MTTFTDATGNLLEAEADALVNTVNTVGVMGKGIALQFKNAYPAMFKAYAKACKQGEVRLGEVWVYDAGQITHPRWVVNFPTKGHWRSKSRMRDIEAGLEDLRRVIKELGITSIALPPLGCGNGGLDWAEVRPLIEHGLDGLDVEVLVYAPRRHQRRRTWWLPQSAQRSRRARPPWWQRRTGTTLTGSARRSSRSRSSCISSRRLANRFSSDTRHRSTVPYADNLRHVLKALEGHHLRGFGDGSKKVKEAEPIEVLPGAAEEAETALAQNQKIGERLSRVLTLAEGYETPYGMELLATVHWAMTRDVADPDDLDAVVERVQSWNRRKARMFTADHIAAAWERLRSLGWAGVPQPA